jgi:hypothetical protein
MKGAAPWLALGAALVLALGCGDDAADGALDAGQPGPASDAAVPGDAASDADDAGAQDAASRVDAGDAICAACDGQCEESLVLEPAIHVDGPIDYADKPPAGGPHAPCWGDYAPYLDPPLPAEEWVHNLEHGGVVLLYHCPDGCDAELAELIALGLSLPRVIVTEYSDMPAGFAAVSWGHRLVTSCFDRTALEAFYAAHFDRAPESIGSGRPGGC